jgi:hypothetical protein
MEGSYSWSTPVYMVYEAIWKDHTQEVRLYIVYFTYYGRVILMKYACIYGIWVNIEDSYSRSTPVYSVLYLLWKGHTHYNRLYSVYFAYFGRVILMKYACIYGIWGNMKGSYSWSTPVFMVYGAIWKVHTHEVLLFIVYSTYYGRFILMKYAFI